jgi:hypothetical protein
MIHKYTCPKCDSEFEHDSNSNNMFVCSCSLTIFTHLDIVSGWEIEINKFTIITNYYWRPEARFLSFLNGPLDPDIKIPYISPKFITEERIEKLKLLL